MLLTIVICFFKSSVIFLAATRTLHLTTPRGRRRRRRLSHRRRRRRSSENARQSSTASRQYRTAESDRDTVKLRRYRRRRDSGRNSSHQFTGGSHPSAPHRKIHQGHTVANVERCTAPDAVPRVPVPGEGGERRGRHRPQGVAQKGCVGRHLRDGFERNGQQWKGEYTF